MRDINLDNQLKILSQYIYHNNKINLPNGYTKILMNQNIMNGFYAQAFYNGKDIIIAYRGTDLNKGSREKIKDFRNDYSLAKKKLPNQTNDALNFYKKIKQEYPNKNVVLTGHSLGGSLAQIVGSITGAKTTTFEAYGTKNYKAVGMKHSDNITNYGNAHDFIFMNNLDNQVGNTYVLNDYKTNDGYVYKISPSTHAWKYSFEDHKLENIGDLSKAIEYHKDNGLEFGNRSNQVFKASIEYNVDKNANQIFTREDVRNMSKEEFKANEDKIMKQVYAIGLPTKAEVMANEKKSKSLSSSHKDVSDGGSWVTINGNHVLL